MHVKRLAAGHCSGATFLSPTSDSDGGFMRPLKIEVKSGIVGCALRSKWWASSSRPHQAIRSGLQNHIRPSDTSPLRLCISSSTLLPSAPAYVLPRRTAGPEPSFVWSNRSVTSLQLASPRASQANFQNLDDLRSVGQQNGREPVGRTDNATWYVSLAPANSPIACCDTSSS